MTHNDNLAAPTTIVDNTIGDIYVKLSGSTTDGWALFWHDGVVNDFTEHYTDLPIAHRTGSPRSAHVLRTPRLRAVLHQRRRRLRTHSPHLP